MVVQQDMGKDHSYLLLYFDCVCSFIFSMSCTLPFNPQPFFCAYSLDNVDDHRICGMARLSKRSLVAVAIFMTLGIAAATICLPICKVAKFLRTTIDHLDDFFPTEISSAIATTLIGFFGAVSISKFVTVASNDSDDEMKQEELKNDQRKLPVAMFSAAIFSVGLFVSGMTKNYKIHGFLDMKKLINGSWDPTLVFVMGSGLIVSAISYQFVKGSNYLVKNEKVTLSCPLLQSSPNGKFNVPTNTKIDKKLVIGASLFGLGWGIAGLCPGPALFLAANGYPQVLYYWWPSNIFGALLAEKSKKLL